MLRWTEQTPIAGVARTRAPKLWRRKLLLGIAAVAATWILLNVALSFSAPAHAEQPTGRQPVAQLSAGVPGATGAGG